MKSETTDQQPRRVRMQNKSLKLNKILESHDQNKT